MMILGTIASSYFAPSGDFESIASVTLSSETGWINFNSIPQNYKHLQVRIVGRTVQSGTTFSLVSMLCNSDQTSSYSWHWARGNGTTSAASGVTNSTSAQIGYVPQNGHASGRFGAIVVDIYNYTNITQNKTIRAYGGYHTNGGTTPGIFSLNSSLWQNTNAITQLSFSNQNNSFDWVVGTTISLYGIKGE